MFCTDQGDVMREKEITRTLQVLRNTNSKHVHLKGHPGASDSGDDFDDVSLLDILRKSWRHKGILFSVMFMVMASMTLLFLYKGTWYQRETIAQYNNYENNSLFQYLDNLLPSDSKVTWDSPAEYAARAIHALKSDDFLKLIMDKASDDPKIKDAFKLGSYSDLKNNKKAYDELIKFIDANIDFTAQVAGGSRSLLSSGGGRFKVVIKSSTPEDADTTSDILQRLITDFLAKREVDDVSAARQLVSGLLQEKRKELTEMNSRFSVLQSETPATSLYTYEQVDSALQAVRASIAGNASLVSRYNWLMKDIEKKMLEMNEKEKDLEEIGLLRQEAAGLVQQRNLARVQGMHENSMHVKGMNAQLQETLQRLNELSKSNLKSDFGLSESIVEKESRVITQNEAISELKDNAHYFAAKANKLEETLKVLQSQINLRLVKEAEKLQLSREIQVKGNLISSLDMASVRLDFADFKSVRRLEFFPGPIQEKTIMPLASLFMMALILGALMGIFAGFTVETRDPSLRNVRVFEELGVPVLGGLPANEAFLLSNADPHNKTDEKTALAYSRIGINLGNILTFIKSKVVLFTSADTAALSGMVLYNLATYYARTGRKTLIIDADLASNYISRLTGVPLSGGLEGVYSHRGDVDIKPVEIERNLQVLTGDGSALPAIRRLASEGFLDLIHVLGKEYDYIFIHAGPCLSGPDAADLSRYSGVSVICSNAKNLKISKLQRVTSEMKLFLSKYSYFVLDGVDDASSSYDTYAKDNNKKSKRGPKVDNVVPMENLKKSA